MQCTLVGVPMEDGAGRPGCAQAPAALRAAGFAQALEALGHTVIDRGDVHPASAPTRDRVARVAAWIAAGAEAAYRASGEDFTIFLGGDHAIAAGTVAGVARRMDEDGRPLFLLWLDAHPDVHTLDTTTSGNLHGVPLAYLTGQPGFEGRFPPLSVPVEPARTCAIGLRSVDPAENAALARTGIAACDMSQVDRRGIAAPVVAFLERVRREDGRIHVSLDADFLDPAIAPGTGTPVPGGATFREAHLTMELLHESGLVASLDLVELNPLLDPDGRTAHLMIDLAASLLGRRILGPAVRAA